MYCEFTEKMKVQIEENVETGTWQIKQKELKKNSSHVWTYIYEVYDAESRVENAYFCNQCHKGIYNTYEKGNTMIFNRHQCVEGTQNGDKNETSLIVRPDIKKAFQSAAANFISKDIRPFLAIEGKGLFSLCLTAMKFGQTYKKATAVDLAKVMPSRNTVRSALAQRAEEVKNKIKTVLSSAREIGGFAITSDSWTDNFRRLTYICLVAHCNIITTQGVIQRHRFKLYVNEITELVKTKQVIVNYILKVLGDYGFSEDDVKKFVTFVTDRGSNFKYGLISNGFDRHNCYAHLLHNLVKAMFKSDRMKEFTKTAAKINAFVKRSGINKELTKSVKSFSTTRWNGIYIMITSIGQNYAQLEDLLYQRQRKNPKEKYFDLLCTLNVNELQMVSEFLYHFKVRSDQIEGDEYETLSMVWPLYDDLDRLLTADILEEDEGSIVEVMKTDGLAYLNAHRKDFEPNVKHKMATLLNPVCKKLPSSSQSERNEVYKLVEEEIDESSSVETQRELVLTRTVSTPVCAPKRMDIFGLFCQIDSEPPPSTQQTELQRYLNHLVTDFCDVTEWWNEHREIYPKLFRLFAKISCIPAASGSAERIFSEAGLVVTSRRSLILPENVNNIIISRNSV